MDHQAVQLQQGNCSAILALFSPALLAPCKRKTNPTHLQAPIAQTVEFPDVSSFDEISSTKQNGMFDSLEVDCLHNAFSDFC